MPPLLTWLARFALPSVLSILATYVVLRLTQANSLRKPVAKDVEAPGLSLAGRMTALGIAGMAIALLLASAFDSQLGWPPVLRRPLRWQVVAVAKRKLPTDIVRGVSWSVLPLVAGLFVLVEGLAHTGALKALSDGLHQAAAASVPGTGLGRRRRRRRAVEPHQHLPTGLIAGQSFMPRALENITNAILIGVDLGPNLQSPDRWRRSCGWIALRREDQRVGAWPS